MAPGTKIAFNILLLVAPLAACNRQLNEAEARQVAAEEFSQTVKAFHLDKAAFDGPIESEGGGAQFFYEWTLKPNQHWPRPNEHLRGILVFILPDGHAEANFIPEDSAQP
ncbi:MAG: hypothetical protein JSR25_12690 [Proteobacteria bacterium]|nr:hypothetical protein [Pseudomonadota bacterium]